MGLELGVGVGLSYGAGSPVVYLLRDEFATAEAAPLTSPRTAEPGPGTGTITDTLNNASISGSNLVMAALAGFGDPGIVYDGSLVRALGRALVISLDLGTSERHLTGWLDTATPLSQADLAHGFGDFSGNPTIYDNGADVRASELSTAATRLAIILRTTGAYYLTNTGSEWVLNFVGALGAVATLYPATLGRSVGYDLTADYFRVADLGSPWDTEYGPATERLSGARSGGDTFTHEADALLELTVDTIPTAGTIDFHFRIQDATNYWQLQVNSSGDLLLNEVVSGTPTTRGSSLAAVAGGERVILVVDDEAIDVFVDQGTPDIAYASAANFKTETSGELDSEGTGGAVSNIVSWPRVLSGAAAGALERV